MPKDFFIETGLVIARVFKSTGIVLRCGPVDTEAMLRFTTCSCCATALVMLPNDTVISILKEDH